LSSRPKARFLRRSGETCMLLSAMQMLWRALHQDLQFARIGNNAGTSNLQVSPLRMT